MTFRVDHSFIYTPSAPVLPSETFLTSKVWGEPPSSDEIFSTSDLEEFAGTDFSYLRFFVPSIHQSDVHMASPYDPYAEVHLSGMQSMPHVPLTSFDPVPHAIDGGSSHYPSVIPGFAPETPSMEMDIDVDHDGGSHLKHTPDPPFERDHPSGSPSEDDLYGSAPHNLSPPRGSNHPKSSQGSDQYDRQLTRKFDTSTLLHVIPEVRSCSFNFAQRPEADNPTASFLPCAFYGSLRCSPIAHSTVH